jgi:Tfp pilus assembly major pilin PilA
VLASNVFAWLYSALLESSSRQATLGKMAFRIRVTDLDGQRIGFGRATGRYFGKIVSSIAFGIGFVMAGFTQRRQALHDKIARTLVLRKDTDVERLAAHPIAPKVATWAVALLILVAAVVPVTGMLAAIAIPAYQDYTIRTQVADGLASAAAYKAAVAEAVASDLDWENITTEALGLEAQPSSQYLASTEVVMGVVVLTFSDAANSNIAGGQLLLVPGLSEGGDVVWVCGYGAAPDGVELVIDKHEQYTDVERKYLPAACRS